MVKLMPEQREAVMRLRSGKILAGGVGSGKSLTSLAYYLHVNVEANQSKERTEYPIFQRRDLRISISSRQQRSVIISNGNPICSNTT